MNFQSAYIILSFAIFVKIRTSAAKRIKSKEAVSSSDIRNRYSLNSPQFNLYYTLLNKPPQYWKLVKKKKREDILTRPFVDLTRLDDLLAPEAKHTDLNQFSQDYIDLSELARYENAPNQDSNEDILFKLKPQQNAKELVDHDFLKILKPAERRMLPYQKRSNVKSNSDESSDSDSDNEEPTPGNHGNYGLKNKDSVRYVPKRFEVINNSWETQSDFEGKKIIHASTETSAGDDNDESDTRHQIDNNSQTESDEEDNNKFDVYVQSPTRFLNTKDVERRRLKHFMPKRVHWDEKDFQSLRNYWIAGPRGRYPGHYKTPF